MPRMTDDEKLTALEKRKADIRAMQLRLNRQLRAVQSRKKVQAPQRRFPPQDHRRGLIARTRRQKSRHRVRQPSCSACSINIPGPRTDGCSSSSHRVRLLQKPPKLPNSASYPRCHQRRLTEAAAVCAAGSGGGVIIVCAR